MILGLECIQACVYIATMIDLFSKFETRFNSCGLLASVLIFNLNQPLFIISQYFKGAIYVI